MLSAAKHLPAERERPFAALRVTPGEAVAARQPCHAERSEASPCRARETLRCAQGDTRGSTSQVGHTPGAISMDMFTPQCSRMMCQNSSVVDFVTLGDHAFDQDHERAYV